MEKFAKNQMEILNLFRRDVFLSKTIREISLMLKKSYSRIHDAISELEHKNIIHVKRVGKSKVCELNLSPESISIFSFLDEQEAFSKNIPNIQKILEFEEFLDDIILITGSYVSKKQNSMSDIDLVVIAKSDVFKKQKLIENLTHLFIPVVHPTAISYKNFIEMLLDKEQNYGKEIFTKRLIFRNSSRYYELIKEAIKNGFKS